MQYKPSGFWNRDCERSLRWDDPDLVIYWPLQEVKVSEPLLAAKDADAPIIGNVGVSWRGVCLKVLLTGANGQLGQALMGSIPCGVQLIATTLIDSSLH